MEKDDIFFTGENVLRSLQLLESRRLVFHLIFKVFVFKRKVTEKNIVVAYMSTALSIKLD